MSVLVTAFKIQIIILYSSITIPLKQISPQNYLGLILDSKLGFGECLQNITNKVCKNIDLLLKFKYFQPSTPLINVFKS